MQPPEHLRHVHVSRLACSLMLICIQPWLLRSATECRDNLLRLDCLLGRRTRLTKIVPKPRRKVQLPGRRLCFQASRDPPSTLSTLGTRCWRSAPSTTAAFRFELTKSTHLSTVLFETYCRSLLLRIMYCTSKSRQLPRAPYLAKDWCHAEGPPLRVISRPHSFVSIRTRASRPWLFSESVDGAADCKRLMQRGATGEQVFLALACPRATAAVVL